VPGFDREQWDHDGFCPQARNVLVQSNLDQVYIACASQAGPAGGYEFLGSSVVSDPYGKAVLGPLAGSRHELGVVGIELDSVQRAQDRDRLINPRRDRRTDVYGLAVNGTVL
jgi:predicted amidohydrolase